MMTRSAAVSSLAVLVIVVVAAIGSATAQQQPPSPQFPLSTAAAGIDIYLTRNVHSTKPRDENSFTVSFPSSANSTFYAGQEIRMRIATTLFNTEQFRHSPKSSPFNGETPHNAKIALYRQYRSYNNSQLRTNWTLFPGFNISGPSTLRVRVVPAFSSRSASSGRIVPCRDQTDVWAEFWGMSGRTFAWGKSIAFSAYTTFVVPPFYWKVCYKDVTPRNRTAPGMNRDYGRNYGWREFDNLPGVQPFRQPLYRFVAPTRMHVDDFAAIKVIANGREHKTWNHRTFDSHDHRMSGLSRISGDQIKLVPAGFPCTYEKSSATADLVHNTHPLLANVRTQYCGSNYVKAGSGDFVSAACVLEGSLEHGGGYVGSETKNPWAAHTTFTSNEIVPSGVDVVGYFRLPRAGKYDICFSPVNYRLALLNVTLNPIQDHLVNAVPVWFKLFRSPAALGCPQSSQPVVAPCNSYVTAVDITDGVAGPSPHGLAWEATETASGTWGTIKITGSGLNANAATVWEYSDPRQYVTTVGGDQFRLVDESHFTSAQQTIWGDLISRSKAERLQTTIKVCDGPSCTTRFETVNRLDSLSSSTDLMTPSAGHTVQYQLSAPGEGTGMSAGGCFATDGDNFGSTPGHNVNVGEMCCTVGGSGTCVTAGCSLSDEGDRGVTASGDLGTNPRSLGHPWVGDGSGLSAVWAYVRFPAGRYRVCYRKAGTENWRALPRFGNRGLTLHSTPSLAATSNFTYYLNDTASHSLGVFVVSAAAPILTKEDHTYNHPAVADSAVVGSSLKIVKGTQSCYTSVGEHQASSTTPGSLECTFAQCSSAGACPGCLGFADNDNALTRTVYFYLRVPDEYTSPSEYYRVCFRHRTSNWYQLRNPRFKRHPLATTADRLAPERGQQIEYDLTDRREGTWGRFTFRRLRNPSPRLNAQRGPVGDVVRVILNETYHGTTTNCATQWDAPSDASAVALVQRYNPQHSVGDVGISCAAAGSSTACATARVSPTSSAGINGFFPYATLDSHSDAAEIPDADGTVAFLRLPPALDNGKPAGYRVCYKQGGGKNWVEAVPRTGNQFLALRPAPLVTASVAHYPRIYSGMYGFIQLTSPASEPIVPANDLVKLVDDRFGCDREAAGSLSSFNLYISMAGSNHNTRGGARIVDGTTDSAAAAAAQASTLTSARVYMTFPTINETGTQTGTSTPSARTYNVCYMKRQHSGQVDANWQHLLTITVHSLGIVFDATAQPLRSGVTSMRFLALTQIYKLNTVGETGDRFKIVPDADPCADGVMPFGVTSRHVGLSHIQESAAAQERGVADLGPADELEGAIATVTLTLPHTGDRLRVCYKAVGLPWVELEQIAPRAQTYPLFAGMYNVHPSGISTFVASASLRSQDPVDAAYQQYSTGLLMTSTFVAGATGTFTFTPVGGKALLIGDRVKLVMAADETQRGVWRAIDGATCESAADRTWTTISIGTARGSLPVVPGRYLVCYAFANNASWFQVNSGDAAYGNPIVVVASNLFFSVALSTTTSDVTVYDMWTGNNEPLGSVSSADLVYFVNRSGTCGVSDAFNNQPVASAGVMLNQTAILGASTGAASRFAVLTAINNVVVGTRFAAKACYYKSQRTATASSSASLRSFLAVGWYELTNFDAPQQREAFIVATPTRVVLTSCPSYSLNATIRTGLGFEVTATIQDAAGEVVPFVRNVFAREVRVVATSSIVNSHGQCTIGQAPSFGWLPSNLRQYTTNGFIRFFLTPVGACPAGGCRFYLASDGLADSATCTFGVDTTVASYLRVVSAPTEVRLGRAASMRVALFSTDGGVAHTVAEPLFASVVAGAGVSVSTGSTPLSASATAVGSTSDGYLLIPLLFNMGDPALFAADTAVTIAVAMSNNQSTTVTILVRRPVVVGVHIVDLFPDSSARVVGGESTHVQQKLIPAWEPVAPTSFFGGGFAVVNSQSALTAAPGYYLVAQQYYTATLRIVISTGGELSYASRVDYLLPSQRAVTIGGSAGMTGNEILGFAADCATNPGCGSALGATSFVAPQQRVTFRLKNSIGCSKASPCTLTFKFGGAAVGASATSITTPVRSIATKLSPTCYVNTRAAVLPVDLTGLVGAATCGTSTIERGWILVVRAVDSFGTVDEFFEGSIQPALRSDDGDATTRLTTVPDLRQGLSRLNNILAVNGVATLPFVTLSRPCPGTCALELLSDWGTEVAHAGPLRVTPSTERLRCNITTPLVACAIDSDGNCASISGKFVYDASNAAGNAISAIYPDTRLCVDVEAVNANNEPTLYDTVWIHYHLIGVPAGASLTITDTRQNTDFRRRYQPMVNGRVQFCFTVSGTFGNSTVFGIRFAAQRFSTPGHWTTGAGAECSVRTLSLFSRKHIAQLMVTQTYRDAIPLVGYPTATPHTVFSRRVTAKSELIFDLQVYDHYNNIVQPSQMIESQRDLEAVLDHCKITGLNSTCVSGSLGTAPGGDQPAVTTSSDPRVSGAVIIELPVTPRSKVVGGNMQYSLLVDKYCVGCFIRLRLKHPGDVEYRTVDAVSGMAYTVNMTMELSVLLIADKDVKRMVSFVPGRSPTRHWFQWQSTNAALTGTILFNESCVTNRSLGCPALESKFLNAVCDSRPTSYLYRDGANNPIEMIVSVAETAARRNRYFEAACLNDDCNVGVQVMMQADILNSFVVGINAGSQNLQCLDSGCIDDATSTPKKTISAFGATAREAVLAFRAAGFAPRTASFTVAGLFPSDFYITNTSDGTFAETGLPSRSGRLGGIGISNQTEVIMENLQTDLSLIWRGGTIAKRLTFLTESQDAHCPPRRTLSCVSGAGGACPSTGYKTLSTRAAVAFNYSGGAAVAGVPFPIALDVAANDGSRVFGANGQISLTLHSWGGCNNGGTMTVTGDLVLNNGRLAVMLTFSEPCENCVLRAALTPDPSQEKIYADLRRNPANLIALSLPFNVRPSLPPASHVLVTSEPAALRASATVADVLTVDVETVSLLDRLAVLKTDEAATIAVYTTIHSSAFNHLWYGNGGILRTSPSAAPATNHHGATTSVAGTGTVSFMFTRTCTFGCGVTLFFQFANGNTGSFPLRNAAGDGRFTVTTLPSLYMSVGFRPRTAEKNDDFAISVWHVGSEARDIDVAGVASSGYTSTATVSSSVADQSNGDGGLFEHNSYLLGRSEIHRLRFSRPCARCVVTLGLEQHPLLISTEATRLRVTPPAAGLWRGSFPSAAQFAFELSAIDHEGFVDELYGGNPDCLLYAPFFCARPSRTVDVYLTTNISTAIATMKPFDVVAATVTGTLSAGRKTISAAFASPVRLGFPLFVTSDLSGVAEHPVLLSSPADSFAYAVASPASSNAIAFVPTSVAFALARDVSGLEGSFIVGDANNNVTITYSNCPARMSASEATTLTAGFVNLTVVFANPSSDGQLCTIRASVVSTASSRCNPCNVEASVTVSSVVANSARFISPSTWDNDGAPPGPRFGAAGRAMRVELQLTGQVGSTTVDVTSCDDPSTSAVESCTFTAAATAACTNPPVVTGSGAPDANGRAVLSLQWRDIGDAAYTCEITVTASRGSTALLQVTETVTVCKPRRLVILSNFTRSAYFRTGVPYPMHVAVVDAAGARCFGDSQASATQLTLDVVTANSNVLVPLVHAINTNATRFSSPFPLATARDPAAASNRVQVIAGAYMLSLVFTNSSVVNGLTGIKVRISSPLSTVFSPPFETVIAATKLRFNRQTLLPRYAVSGRPIFVPGAGRLIVEAVDAVDPLWVTMGLIPSAPNVATRTQDFGSNAVVSWFVFPPTGTFPLTFATGTRDVRLSGGRTNWTGVTWTGADSTVTISVRTTAALAPTEDFPVTFQTPHQLAFNTSLYHSAPQCRVDGCAPPNGNGSFPTGHSFVEIGPGLHSIFNLRWFPLFASVLDVSGAVVEGEQESVIEALIVGSGTDTVHLATPDDFTVNVTHMQRTVNGRASFNLSFVGATTNTTTIRIMFRCPPTRPAALMRPGDTSAANPCFGRLAVPNITSASIVVRDSRPPADLFRLPEVLARTPVLKFRSTATAVETFRIDLLAAELSASLYSRGFYFMSRTNAEGVVDSLSCLVDRSRFRNADLGSSVCVTRAGDALPTCDINNNASCPSAVLKCACSASSLTRAATLRRYLLQTTPNGTDVQGELTFSLWRASAFTGSTVADIVAVLTRLGVHAEDIMRSDTTLRTRFMIDPDSVLLRSAADPIATVPPATPAPTPAPTARPPPPPSPAPTAAAAHFSVVLAVALQLVLALTVML